MDNFIKSNLCLKVYLAPSVDYVLDGLLKIGFDDVFEVAAAAELVSAYTRKYLKTEREDNEKLNELIKKLNKDLDDANYEISGLERELKKSRIRQNQRTFFLENRLDIAYTKLAELRYTLDEFEKLGFFERVRGKKPKSYDEIDI